MLGNLIAGVVSGLFVTVSVFAFRIFWLSKIVPWFEERVYKDAKIEGEWFSLYPMIEGRRQEIISLKRHGHAITGTIICTRSEGDEGEQYDVHGSFRNMILPLIYETHDRSKTDRGTITLKLTQNAKQLTGRIALYSDKEDTILSTDVIWFRSKKRLEAYLADLETLDKATVEEYRQRLAESEKARRWSCLHAGVPFSPRSQRSCRRSRGASGCFCVVINVFHRGTAGDFI